MGKDVGALIFNVIIMDLSFLGYMTIYYIFKPGDDTYSNSSVIIT